MPTVAGTGWTHVTGGTWDANARTPTATDVGADAAGAAASALSSAETYAANAVAALVPDIQRSKWALCTGIITGGQISINASDHTKLDIAAGTALYVDNSSPNSPVVDTLTWSMQTVTPVIGGQSLDTLMLVWAGIYRSAPGVGTPVFSVGFSETDRRVVAVLGRLWSNGVNTTITQVGNYQSPAWGWSKKFEDFCVALGGSLNVSGNVFSPYPGALRLQKSAGESFRLDGNANANRNSPDLLADAQQIPQTQYIYWACADDSYRNQFSAYLDPNYYDLGGTRTIVPDGQWTVQRLYYFAGSGLCVVTYGQAVYASMDAAKEGVTTESVVFSPTAQSMFYGAVLRGWCILQKGCTDTDPTAGTCAVLAASQFMAGGASGGGASITNHSLLSHLDYASAGHTGFAPSSSPTFLGTITRSGLGLPAVLPGNAVEAYDTIIGATLQTNVQNLSADGSASSDVVATADNGSNVANFVDMGINSSGYNDSGYTSGGPDDAYLLVVGGNLGVIAGTATKSILFFTGGTTIDKLRATLADAGLTVVGAISASNLSGTNTGDETSNTIKTKLGITTLSGSNTGDQTLGGLGGVPTSRTVNGKALSGDVSLSASDVGADAAGAAAAITLSGLGGVATGRKINGYDLTQDRSLTYSDVGADAAGAAASAAAAITLAGLGGVASTVTVNGKALSGNITITVQDFFPDCGVLLS
jgi:hypothetical protein